MVNPLKGHCEKCPCPKCWGENPPNTDFSDCPRSSCEECKKNNDLIPAVMCGIY